MKTEPGLQCGSVTDNAISFHEHACEKVPITVEMNVHTHRPQSWDQHPGEARHTQATVVGPAPGGSTSHTGHSCGTSTRGKHVTHRPQLWEQHPGEARVPGPHGPLMPPPATATSRKLPSWLHWIFFALNNDLSTLPQFFMKKAGLGNSFLSYFSRLRKEKQSLFHSKNI